MKKIIVMIVAIVALGTSAIAQEDGNHIGVRLGDGYGTNAEISYQMGLGGNRAEFDLGVNMNNGWNYIHLAGVYQWIGNISGGLGWYAGVGASMGIFKGKYNGFGLGIAGQIGLSYDFPIPLQLTLGMRPEYDFLGYSHLGWGGVALGIRYRF